MKRITALLAALVLLPAFGGCMQDDSVETETLAIWQPSGELPLFEADVSIALRVFTTGHIGKTTIFVADANGNPAGGVEVRGSYLGDVSSSVSGVTDSDGIVSFSVSTAAQHLSLGFQVTGIAYQADGKWTAGKVSSNTVQPVRCFHGP